MNEDKPAMNAATQGAYVRDASYIQDRIVSDLPAGSEPVGQRIGEMRWPVEARRYRLMAARACPWANRTIITRRILGLEDAISLSLAAPTHGEASWNYQNYPDGVDPVLGVKQLRDAYNNRVPDYPKGITVPAVAEVASKKVVTNDYDQIVKDFITEWKPLQREGAPDLWPEGLRDQIEHWNTIIYPSINNGVYRCGFAASQDAYEAAYRELWDGLDQVSEHLSTHRYLVGEHITLADIRLFPTLVRFDAVYHGHFKANRSKISEIPVLQNYLRDLFQTPGFGDTIDFENIKQHYYGVHRDVNPTGIVPVGPDMSALLAPHGREQLGGSPWGDATAPAPVRPDEVPDNNPLFA